MFVTAVDNPFDGVLPDFTIFGAEFTELWQKILAGAWGLSIVIAAIFLIVAIVKMAGASASENPGAHKQARSQAMWSGIALACLAGIAVITGAILTLVG